jgi:hypothetical protein
MFDDDNAVRKVAWSELFPWLILFRCFSRAIGFRVLTLSTIGVTLTLCGWSLLASCFPKTEPPVTWETAASMVPNQPQLGLLATPGAAEASLRPAVVPFVSTWQQLSQPAANAFSLKTTGGGLLYSLLAGLWALAVWAICGGAVTRTVAVDLACGERVPWGKLVPFVATRFRAYFAAPLIPLAVVAAVTAGSALFGLLLRADWSTVVAGLLWPCLLLAWAAMTLLLVGLLFGWPLMFPTISVEGMDSFDALSRSNNYTFHRPLHYLFYALVATFLGILGWWLVSNVAAAVIYLPFWAASWGGGEPRIAAIIQHAQVNEPSILTVLNAGVAGPAQTLPLSGAGKLGAGIIWFWVLCVKLVALGFLYSYFWTASTAVYYLLRRDVDATEMDEVYLEDDKGEAPQGLPPLKTDETGIPVVGGEVGAAEMEE